MYTFYLQVAVQRWQDIFPRVPALPQGKTRAFLWLYLNGIVTLLLYDVKAELQNQQFFFLFRSHNRYYDSVNSQSDMW